MATEGRKHVQVPAKLLMCTAACVSTLVSMLGGYIMFRDAQALLLDTVEETSAIDAVSIARKLNDSYVDVHEASLTVASVLNRWHVLRSTEDFLDFWVKYQFASINVSANLYSITVQTIPWNGSDAVDPRRYIAYTATWYDALADGTREWIVSTYRPEEYGKYRGCHTDPGLDVYCQRAWTLDRFTGEISGKAYDWVNNQPGGLVRNGTYWQEQQVGWETEGATWWRHVDVWRSSDNTPYMYASFNRVLPLFDPSIPLVGGWRKVVISTFFTFMPWDAYLTAQDSPATLVAAFLDAGLDSQVLATNRGVATMETDCARDSVASGNINMCIKTLKDMHPKIQTAALRMNESAVGEFVTHEGMWMRRVMIHDRDNPLDEMPPTHLLWLRDEDDLWSSLWLFIGFVAIVLVFDVAILIVEIAYIAKPLEKLEKALRPLDTMDLDEADARASGVLSKLTVTEVLRLTRRFQTALVALRDYRRFIPQSVLVADTTDEERPEEWRSTESPGSEDAESGHVTRTGSSGSGSTPGTQQPLRPVRPKARGGLELSEFRSRKATVLLTSSSVHSAQAWAAGAGRMPAPGRIVSVILSITSAHGGVTGAITVVADLVEVLVSWNALRPSTTHATRAAEAAIEVRAVAHKTLVTPTFAVATGTTYVGNVGNEVQRVTLLAGTPVSLVASLTKLSGVINAGVLCSASTYEHVSSDVVGRVVDAIHTISGHELLVYELLKPGGSPRDDQTHFFHAFSALRGCRYEEAQRFLVLHLAEQGHDQQAVRLYRLSLFLAGSGGYGDAPFTRAEQESYPRPESDSAPLPEEVLKFVPSDADTHGVSSPSDVSGPHGAKFEQRRATQCEADMLKEQIREAYANLPAGDPHGNSADDKPRIPTMFHDARGRGYHRSDKSLGRGAFGEVWLGMGTNGAMVAVKAIQLRMGADRSCVAGLAPEPAGGLLGAAAVEEVEDDPWTIGGVSDSEPMQAIRTNSDSGFQTFSQPGQTVARRHVAEMVQEVALMISLKHDNVVQFLGCAVQNAHVLIVMEYLPGGSLSTILRQYGGKLPPTCVKRFVRDIVAGLRFMHSNHIVHRDLKPANVLLTIDGECKLADFGASAELKQVSSGDNDCPVGTPLYMPPEQTHGKASTASDIWSLGIILVELVTGKQPWGDVGNQLAFMTRLGADDSLLPSIPQTVAGDARDLAESCIQREERRRPAARKLLNHPFLIS
eukprot:TRINITY_DN1624_c0_g1_i6.p1 TRINITY_DN1624_c0_g1~~TRINITY_DN1624_c0_g1_i6.p1  ORF type:complete len:1243 (+),score=292.09 TRINITY_DN1624_c0_g1_i6:93-3731(+)